MTSITNYLCKNVLNEADITLQEAQPYYSMVYFPTYVKLYIN